MSHDFDLERLRTLFAERESTGEARDRPDPETIWRAVTGELPTEQIERLSDQLAEDPELAAEWRIALDLHRAQEAASPGVITRLPGPEDPAEAERFQPDAKPGLLRRVYFAAAAAVIVSVTGGLLFWTSHRSQQPQAIYRGQEEPTMRSLVEPELPREDFVLRWSPLSEGALYELVVSDSELEILFGLENLAEPQAQVPGSELQSLAPGSIVRWQVVATDREGRRHASATFEVRVR